MTTRRIAGREFLRWLTTAGIVPERTSRVVIDAAADGAVLMYVTMYGDESLISVKPPPELGVEVMVVGSTTERPMPKAYKTGLRVDGEWLEVESSARETV